MALRLHHPSLPAPVVHATFSVTQSKSHVLAGVQDAYWSDDEAEDADCPLCLEEMDISDLNFKPCICGYQICRFCWHHIKENLNKRCPACRRVYTDDAVEFKPIPTQDHKRLTQQKKQRDRERKELEALGRRQLANVRVVQRNVVYVLGIGPRFAKEELIPTLRSNDYFGQYGKITKILLVKRTSSGGAGPVVGLYITYHRREDAARAIAAVDGTPSPGGGRDIMRASYGTTKYCMAFLRGISCSDHSCMKLHEWGDEKDCFTKEDLTTLKHTMKATESRTRASTTRKGDEDAGLPRAAAWAQKGSTGMGTNSQIGSTHGSTVTTSMLSRQGRRGGVSRQARNISTNPAATNESRVFSTRTHQERKLTTAASQASSRPSTPSLSTPQTVEVVDVKATQQKKETIPKIEPANSPAPSATTESDTGSGLQDLAPSSPHTSIDVTPFVAHTPSNLPSVPPGLSAPPGILSPSRPPRTSTASPQTPLLASQSSYQMSTAARALLDDVKARRESLLPSTSGISPFPDFDRTLQTLSGEDGGGFSFNLDPKLAEVASNMDSLADFDVDPTIPFYGSYVDAFPALRQASQFLNSPGSPFVHPANRSIYDAAAGRTPPLEKQRSPNYLGSFNPFAELNEEPSNLALSNRLSQYSPLDEDRKISRFGFARGRQSSTAASSPLHASSPLSINNNDTHSHYNSAEMFVSGAHGHHEYDNSQPNSTLGSPLVQQSFSQQKPRFQPFEAELSEAQLRDFIQSSRDRELHRISHEQHPLPYKPGQSFSDPAIMSASFVSPGQEQAYHHYGPPPGLSFPQATSSGTGPHSNGTVLLEGHNPSSVPTTSSPVPPTLLSSNDFPALSIPSDTGSSLRPGVQQDHAPGLPSAVQEKADRKAAKKAAATERALERQRQAQETRAARKAKVARGKSTEKEAVAQAEEEGKRFTQAAVKDEKSVVREHIDRHCPVIAGAAIPTGEIISDGAKGLRPKTNLNETPKSDKRTKTPIQPTPATKQSHLPIKSDPSPQLPLLSKKPKKVKPVSKSLRLQKDEDVFQDAAGPLHQLGLAVKTIPIIPLSPTNSLTQQSPTSLEELLEEIDLFHPGMDLLNHPFFDLHTLTTAAKMPLEYGPLVHALSALSVGGGSFANNMPSGSIDNAVSSFQQLLETLTQTISDLLRLLPRTTWDDSSSFDGVLRDMLKGDDFLEDGSDEGQGKEDEVAALTLALERRARWMEVQLSKLEELHRDINTAAVRAVLSFNDNGWDKYGFLPRSSNALRRFDNIGVVEDAGIVRPMTVQELEKKLAVATEAAAFAEAEVREAMEKLQASVPG